MVHRNGDIFVHAVSSCGIKRENTKHYHSAKFLHTKLSCVETVLCLVLNVIAKLEKGCIALIIDKFVHIILNGDH